MDVKRYLIQKTPIGTMMKENPEGNWVEAQDFDRILAERDALQQRLNVVEDENDRLRSLAEEARNEFLTIKGEIGFRAETLRVIGALDKELENRS